MQSPFALHLICISLTWNRYICLPLPLLNDLVHADDGTEVQRVNATYNTCICSIDYCSVIRNCMSRIAFMHPSKIINSIFGSFPCCHSFFSVILLCIAVSACVSAPSDAQSKQPTCISLKSKFLRQQQLSITQFDFTQQLKCVVNSVPLARDVVAEEAAPSLSLYLMHLHKHNIHGFGATIVSQSRSFLPCRLWQPRDTRLFIILLYPYTSIVRFAWFLPFPRGRDL